MSKRKSSCRCCHSPVSDFLKKFDRSLGFVCSECFEFSAYSDKALRKHGIEGSVIDPVRNNPKPETP